jgi:hypothetical protein
VAVTGLIVLAPFVGLAVAVPMLWEHGIGLADVLLAVGLYLITGFGVTIGFPGLAADHPGDRGLDELPGRRHRVGRDPQAPPRLHRPPR